MATIVSGIELPGNPTGKVYNDNGEWVGVSGGQAFPVGSIFLSVVATDPATLLGYGTWVAIAAGRMLVGQDTSDTDFDTLEETGGTKTHTLTEAEIPSHTHVQNSHNHLQDAHAHTQAAHNHAVTDPGHSHTYKSQTATTGSLTSYEHGAIDTSSNEANEGEATDSATTGVTTQNATPVINNTTATNQAATATNQNTGGGQAHNNMPPYFVVRMWKRTA